MITPAPEMCIFVSAWPVDFREGIDGLHKRLEQGRFRWPPPADGVVRLTAAQLSMLLEGLDWGRFWPRPGRAPRRAG